MWDLLVTLVCIPSYTARLILIHMFSWDVWHVRDARHQHPFWVQEIWLPSTTQSFYIGPTLRTQFMTGGITCPVAKKTWENLQQPNHCNTIHCWPYLASRSQGCHYIIEMLTLLDWQTLNLLFIFILSGPRKTWSCDFGIRVALTILWRVLFIKVDLLVLPTPGLPPADMQLKPFRLSLGPGLVMDILSKIISNSGHSCRHDQTGPRIW